MFEGLAQDRLAALNAQVPGYDPVLSPTHEMGLVAETLRHWPGAIRSHHPMSAVTVLGPGAETITEPHPLAFAAGPDGPFGRPAARPAMKILLLGVGWNRCTALHTAETMAARRRYETRRFLYDDGAGRRWIETPDVADDNGRLFPLAGAAFEATGAVAIGRIGAAESRLCGLRDLLDFACAWLDTELAAGRGV